MCLLSGTDTDIKADSWENTHTHTYMPYVAALNVSLLIRFRRLSKMFFFRNFHFVSLCLPAPSLVEAQTRFQIKEIC